MNPMMNSAKVAKRKKNAMKASDWVIYVIFGLLSIVVIYPMYYVLIGSFSDGSDFAKGGTWFFVREFSIDNYRIVLGDARFYGGLLISVLRTALGTVTSLVFTAAVAYGMSRKELVFKGFFRAVNLFTMFFSGGLIPFFLLVVRLGLYGSFWVYIVPGIYSVYNMIVISTFYRGIPEELHEAALMDGAGEFLIMFSIYFRLSAPVFATVGLWIGVAHWNAYYDTMIYCASEQSLHTLQYYLMRVIKEASRPENTSSFPPSVLEKVTDQTISFAAIILGVIPVLFAFPFLHKCFNGGVTIGALKG